MSTRYASHVAEATFNDAPTLPGSKASVFSVYEDAYRPGTWKTTPPNLTKPVEDAESIHHALIARYRQSDKPNKTLELHSILVQSPLLKRYLADVLKNYPGITVELERLEFVAPFECFVHRWEKFLGIHRRVKHDLETSVSSPSAAFQDELTLEGYHLTAMDHFAHLDLLHSVLTEELGPVLREKQDLVKHGVITFEQIWTIFEPGCLVYHQKHGHDQVTRLQSGKFDINKPANMRTYRLDCEFVDDEGEHLGWQNRVSFMIAHFDGTIRISSLEALPLVFHDRAEDVRRALLDRGRKFEALQGFHFLGYEGMAWGKTHRGEAKYEVNSRIIVHAHAWSRYREKLHLTQLAPNEQQRPILSPALHPRPEPETDDDCVLLPYDPISKSKRTVGKAPLPSPDTPSSLTEEQLLCCTEKVRGYSLRDKEWFQFYVDNIKDIEWNDKAFDALVAPPEQKDLILAFAESQIKNAGHFDDVIQGKGKGIIMLLSGPPGVGKTLTCEAVAEAMKVPLFSVGAADLGSKPREVEKALGDILEMCAKWNAVVLLDEADVFLEPRTSLSLDRNRLVSIFLRQLEYFEGIMFLTTNRIESMDPAFESRIHLSLQYHELDKAARRQVWSTFLHRSSEMEESNVGAFSDADLDRLAKVPLNGRQIKNMLKTAQLLASRYDEVLGMKHLTMVLDLRNANEKRVVSFLGGGE